MKRVLVAVMAIVTMLGAGCAGAKPKTVWMDNPSWGFTQEYNAVCAEHNGEGLYRRVRQACEPEAKGQNERIICDSITRAYKSWYNGCVNSAGYRPDPLDYNPKAEAERAAKRAQRIEAMADKAAELGVACRPDKTEGPFLAENIEYAEKALEACTSEKMATDKGKEHCTGRQSFLVMVEATCLYNRALNINPGEAKRVSRGGEDADPCQKEFWASVGKNTGWVKDLAYQTCKKDFLKGVLEKAEAAGIKPVTEAEKLKKEAENLQRENEELEKQLKALQGGKQ